LRKATCVVEGCPGWRNADVKTLAATHSRQFKRIQFTAGSRAVRSRRTRITTQNPVNFARRLDAVFTNLLLAEQKSIARAAKVAKRVARSHAGTQVTNCRR